VHAGAVHNHLELLALELVRGVLYRRPIMKGPPMRTLFAPTLASTLALLLPACGTDPAEPGMDMMEEEQPPQGMLEVSIASSARIVRNQSIELDVTIKRDEHATGPVTVSVDDLPAGITAAPVTIGPDASTAMISLVAGADIALGTHVAATVRATADDGAAASASIDLRLTDKPGALDVSFANTGFVVESFVDQTHESYQSIIRQPSGKLVVAGENVSNYSYSLTRYDASGAIDPTFGTAGTGTITFPSGSTSVNEPVLVQRADGTLLLGTRGSSSSVVYAYTADGSPLLGYGNTSSSAVLDINNLGVHATFAGMTAAPDGGVYVASTAAGNFHVARLDAFGTLDSSFDGDGHLMIDLGGSDASAFVLTRPDGRIVVVGRSTAAYSRIGLAQLNPDGAPDTMFSGDGKAIIDYGASSAVYAAETLADGRVALLTEHSGRHLTFVDPAATIDEKKIADPAFSSWGLAIEGNDIYAIGISNGSVAAAKYFPDGTLDTSFGVSGVMGNDLMTNTIEIGYTAIQDDAGRLVIGGMAKPGADSEMMLARIWL
jgi:uncharacterized delta-60 repeat protein